MILHPLQSSQHKKKLLGVLLFALLAGLFYTFIIPPWQHYDEPTQFEYAWLIANRPGLPQFGDFDQRMRREVAASMIEHGFFEDLDFRPNLLSQTEPVWIGISQLSDQPLYYWIAALPLRILKYTEVTTQLYAARLVSVVFFLGILAAGMGLVQEITGRQDSPLVWLVPLTVTLIPGVQDIMSAVNNDVGAAFFFTLFLWGSARLVRRGPRGFELGWVLAAAAACYFTKPTVYAALVLLPVVVLFSIFRQKRARIAWMIALAGGLLLLVGVTGWGDAAAWTSDQPQAGQNRTLDPGSQDPTYALVMKLSPENPRNILLQALTLDQRNAIKGDLVTLAGWAWSDRAAQVEAGLNSRNGIQIIQPLTTTKEKQYFIAQLDAPEAIDYPWLELRARLAEGERDVQVYFDDLVLLTGEISREEVRELSLLEQPGEQAGGSFENGLANPSAERGWFRLRSWVLQRLPEVIARNLNIALGSISNLPATGWYYRAASRTLFQTFWAGYGWGSVSFEGNFVYPFLGVLSGIGLVGYLAVLYRDRRRINWALFGVLLLAAGVIWGQTLLRGVSSLYGVLLLPAARYALPVVVLTVFPFTAGWLAIARRLDRRGFSLKASLALYLLFLAGLNLLAVYNIYRVYYAA